MIVITYQNKNSINSQSAFCTRSAVCIFYQVCIMYLAYSLHFVMNELVLLFLFERASSPAEILGLAKKF